MDNRQQDIFRILRGCHADPFSFLGAHQDGDDLIIRAYAPHAQSVSIVTPRGQSPVAACERLHEGGLFEARLPASKIKSGYKLGHLRSFWSSEGSP